MRRPTNPTEVGKRQYYAFVASVRRFTHRYRCRLRGNEECAKEVYGVQLCDSVDNCGQLFGYNGVVWLTFPLLTVVSAMSVLFRILCVLFVVSSSSAIRSADLTGMVLDESGVAIEGARVDISTAAPIDGPSLFCPSCYLDCAKWARTDATGRFSLSSLDESLKFRLVITATGKRTHRTELIEPGQSSIEFRMQQIPDDLPASRLLHGRIISDEGVPISGALIEPVGAKALEHRWEGRVDALSAVADDHGEFVMVLGDGLLGVDIQVTAYGYPGTKKLLLSPGDEIHEIELNAGCKVSGRVELLHKFIGPPTLAAVQLDRSNGDRPFMKAVLALVSDDGYFEFPQLPPNEYYAIFSPVNLEDRNRPIVATSLFLCGDDGESLDLGVIKTANSCTFQGKLVTQDSVLPDDLFVSLRRQPAWDLVKVPVSTDGSFVLKNLPPESYEVVINTDSLDIDFSKFRYQPMGRNSFGISSFGNSIVEIPLRKSASKTSSARRKIIGRVVTRAGTPVGGLAVVPTAFGLNQKLGKSIKTTHDGSFSFSSLPGNSFELFFYKSERYYYPRTEGQKGGNTILFPGKLTVYPEQSELEIIYDSSLATGFPLISASSNK